MRFHGKKICANHPDHFFYCNQANTRFLQYMATNTLAQSAVIVRVDVNFDLKRQLGDLSFAKERFLD